MKVSLTKLVNFIISTSGERLFEESEIFELLALFLPFLVLLSLSLFLLFLDLVADIFNHFMPVVYAVFAVLLRDFYIWLYNNDSTLEDALIQFFILVGEKMLDIIPQESSTTCHIFLIDLSLLLSLLKISFIMLIILGISFNVF